MEPEAIRPDRDKTGRQKNPRRSTLGQQQSPGGAGGEETQVADPMDIKAPVLQLPFVSHDLGSACEDPPSSQEMVNAERDMVIETLMEIERICCQLRDNPSQSPVPDSSMIIDAKRVDLSQILLHPSLIARRTEVSLLVFGLI